MTWTTALGDTGPARTFALNTLQLAFTLLVLVLGLALASKWVGAYAIGTIVLLVEMPTKGRGDAKHREQVPRDRGTRVAFRLGAVRQREERAEAGRREADRPER